MANHVMETADNTALSIERAAEEIMHNLTETSRLLLVKHD